MKVDDARCRPRSTRWLDGDNAKKKIAGAGRDPTPQQRGCHPERRSNPAAPRQGIKTASAAAGNQERELDIECCRFSDLLPDDPVARAGSSRHHRSPRSAELHRRPEPESANNNSAKTKTATSTTSRSAGSSRSFCSAQLGLTARWNRRRLARGREDRVYE